MKIRLLLMEIIALILIISITSYSQPVQRGGWPITFHSPGNLVQKGGTTWIEDANGKIIIGLTSQRAIGLFDLDGRALPGWPYNLDDTDWGGNVGPRFGDVDGDGEYEVVMLLRDYYGSIRKLVVKELDGTEIPELCREYGEFSYRGKLSPVVLIDVNNDGDEEIIFTCDSLHVLQGDGSNYPEFPKTIGENYNMRSGPLYIPDSIPNGDVILYSSDSLLFAEPFHATTNFIPWSASIRDSVDHTDPLLIPTEDDWIVVLGNAFTLYAYYSSGECLDGFPVRLTPQEEYVKLFNISACDVDGDGSPEIIARKQDGLLWAFNLQGEALPGFPVGEVWNWSDQVMSLRVFGEEEAYMFYAALYDIDNNAIWGYKGNQLLEGFPGLLSPRGRMLEAAAIIWTENDDTLHIVHNINNGTATVWDYPMVGKSVRLEWPMPGNDPGCKRIYQPGNYLSVPEKNSNNIIPEKSGIMGVYPNPSNSGARIKLMPQLKTEELKIFNVLGKEVWRKRIDSNISEISTIHWNGLDMEGNPVPSGQYFIQLNNNTETRSLVILK